MKIGKEDIRAVVRRVLAYYMRKKYSGDVSGRILFLVPAYPIGIADALAELELYGEADQTDLLLEERTPGIAASGEQRIFCGWKEEDAGSVLAGLPGYSRLVIYSPSLDFLGSLRKGEEKDLFTRIALYFIMAGRETVARLPYRIGELAAGRFSRSVREMKEDLEDMGVVFVEQSPARPESAGGEDGEAYEFVTEELLRELYSKGVRQIRTAEKAVITPLAKEYAGDNKIKLITL